MMRKKWIGGILAALVVGGVGGAVAADDSGQVESIRSSGAQQAEGLRAQLRQARSDSAAAAQHAHDADARADAAGRRARTAEKRARRAALRAIADRDRELDARASDLDSRERKVSGMERDWEANAIPGDGRFRVGSDVMPGVYQARTAGSGNCYWERLGSDSGSIEDIISNGNVAGPVTITVGASDRMLELSGCSTFHKVG